MINENDSLDEAKDSSSEGADEDWSNPDNLKRIVARQKYAEKKGKFDPFAYFGALEMVEIPSEDRPADMRIQKVFNSPLMKKTAKK